MSIQISKLAYVYIYNNKKFDLDLFLDTRTKKFAEALYKVNPEEIGKVETWNGINLTPCSIAAAENEIYSSYYQQKINSWHAESLFDLEQANWHELIKRFPETQSKIAVSTKIKKASDLIVKPPEFEPLFPEWDKIFYGIMPSDFIILYAIMKRGKSTVCSYIAGQLLKAGKRIGFYPTELTPDETLASIYGLMLPVPQRPDESLHYFKKYPKQLQMMNEKYGKNLYIPESNIFDWASYEALYKEGLDFIFLDQMSCAMASLGIEEGPSTSAKFSKQLLTMKLQYMIPTLIVMQEGTRPATQEERKNLGSLADRQEFGTGNPRYTMSPRQDASLSLNVYLDPLSKERKIYVKDDRKRNLTSGERIMEILLDKHSQFEVVGYKDVDRNDMAEMDIEEVEI